MASHYPAQPYPSTATGVERPSGARPAEARAAEARAAEARAAKTRAAGSGGTTSGGRPRDPLALRRHLELAAVLA